MSRLSYLSNLVFDSKRFVKTSTLFPTPTKVALLNFIGLNDFFITEYGTIWNNNRVYRNRQGYVTKGYLSFSVLDMEFPYPWTLLPLDIGLTWMPVNQLLGWAFDKPSTPDRRYYLSDRPTDILLNLSTFSWQKTLPQHSAFSRYTYFLDQVYDIQK